MLAVSPHVISAVSRLLLALGKRRFKRTKLILMNQEKDKLELEPTITVPRISIEAIGYNPTSDTLTIESDVRFEIPTPDATLKCRFPKIVIPAAVVDLLANYLSQLRVAARDSESE